MPVGVGGWWRRDAATLLTFGILAAISYFPSLQGDFLWDDVIFSEEPVIHRWSGLRNIWFSPADIKNEGHYWPIVYTSFWLEHKLWGLTPLGYHVVNLVLHWANCLLVWRLLSRLAVAGAWAVAAVFVVHPLHVDSVAWIIERKDLLSTFFYLTAALTWIRFVEAATWRHYGLALMLYTVGLLSKSVVVSLPVALLIWHWWRRDRVTSTDLFRLAPFFIVGLVITAADYAFYSSRESLALGYSFIERVLIASRALWFYIGKLLWPTDLAVVYPLWDIRAGDPVAWAYPVATVAAVALLWLGRHRVGRGPLAGALFYGVTLSPVLGFVDYGYMQFSFVADRFQYLAGIGVMAVLIGGAAYGADRLPDVFRMTARGVLAVVLALLGGLTWSQAGIYRDEITFFSHVVSLNPAARDAYLNLGGALFEAGRFDEALTASRLAVKHRPNSSTAHTNVGRGLLERGQIDEAQRHLRRALEIDPRNSSARQNMAEALRRSNRHEEAVEAYRRVLRLKPGNELAYGGMGAALFELKRYPEAVAALEKALSLKPRSPRAGSMHLFLGRAAKAQGQLGKAERHIRRAITMLPKDPAALMEMANLRRSQKRYQEAARHLRQARKVSPDDPRLLHTIAETLRKQGQPKDAIESYRAALDADPEFAPAHAGLGIALFDSRRHAEAIEAMARALRLQADLPVAGKLRVFMGRAHQALGQSEEAAEQHERALSIDPRNTEALDHLAMMRFGQKRYEEALRLYRRLADIHPAEAQAHANLGVTLHRLGRPNDALERFEKALSLNPDLTMARTAAEHMRSIIKKARQRDGP